MMLFGRLLRRYTSWVVGIMLLLLFALYYFLEYYSVEVHLVNLKDVLAAAIGAAEAGGVQVVKHSKEFSVQSKGKTEEGAEQYVTDADFKSHCSMISLLNDLFPSIKVISEESKVPGPCPKLGYHSLNRLHAFIKRELSAIPDDINVPSKDITIWLDPLDATQEFTEHLTKYVTTMACVAVQGLPVMGVIHKPFESSESNDPESNGKTYWAWLPIINSQNLNTYMEKSPKVDMEKPNIIISRSHAGTVKQRLANILPNTNITPAGGAGYKVIELIKGDASVYLHTTKIKKWDICAGDAILKAVGGQMTTLNNKMIDYSSDDSEVNDDGILASVSNHEKFYKMFRNIL